VCWWALWPNEQHGPQQLLATGKYKRLTLKPGDKLPVKGLEGTVISSDGALIEAPLPDAGQQNASCKESEQGASDQTENARSLGTILSFGKVGILDLGDLTGTRRWS
jgi:competence protein ComEC